MSSPSTSQDPASGTTATSRGEASAGRRTIESTLVTERLAERTARQPDYASEARALRSIAEALGSSPGAALDALVHAALLTEAPDRVTAGVSLLEEEEGGGGQRFRWTALAGRLASAVGGTTPRDFSPCGVCLDEMQPVLFDRPDLCFTYFLETGVPFIEGLVLPFTVDGVSAGTIWIVSHDEERRFDAEDVRVMTSLAGFTGAIYTVLAARHAAERAREEREWLLQSMGHEWRTPLGAIRSMSSLVAEEMAGPISDRQRDLLARIGGAADHLLSLLDNAQIAARVTPSSTNAIPVAEPDTAVDVAALARETVAMVEPAAREAGLTISCRDGSPSARVTHDATTIRQILINLLGNAIKFTPRGQIDVAVVEVDGRVNVTVADTGIGIDADDVERIFDRYWRAESQSDGSGMGLAISRELARELGGDLRVHSVPGRGSTFTLSFPRA